MGAIRRLIEVGQANDVRRMRKAAEHQARAAASRPVTDPALAALVAVWPERREAIWRVDPDLFRIIDDIVYRRQS